MRGESRTFARPFVPSALPADVVEAPHVVVIGDIHEVVGARLDADPLALRRDAARRGLTAVDLRYPYAGSLSDVEMGFVYEAVGAIDADLREVFGAGHGRLIDRYASDGTRSRWLPRIADGALIGVAVTEPAGGSDLDALRLRARHVEGGWLLDGVKGPMARLTEAAAFVVFAVTDAGLSVFLVEADAAGVTRQVTAIAGLGGWSFGELIFDGVFVEDAALLGRPGEGRAIFSAHFADWRAFMALVAVGAGEAALAQARRWARERDIAKKPLAQLPAVVERFGDRKLALDLARLAAQAALAAPVTERPDLAAQAKVAATEAGHAAIELAISVFGARGLMPSVGLDKRERDVRALQIADGPNDVLRAHLGRAYLRGAS
jgi:alkylation response protein AidB-like acyl-CoA dehydrogenase